jgi:hypothetical protein
MAVKMIEGSDEVRTQKCIQAVNEILEAFDCVMSPIIILGAQGVVQAQCAIKALPRAKQGAEVPQELQDKINQKKPMGPRKEGG